MNDEDDVGLSKLIRANATRHRASPSLESAVRTEIALESSAGRQPMSPHGWRWPAWGSAGLGFAFGIVVSAVVLLVAGLPGNINSLESELTSSHIRALMGNHLTDVASSDQHTVKPWFQGKLDYSPPVRDLSEDGFPLVGGRLDYLSGRTVAALVYRRHGHLINVFVWPTSGKERIKESVVQGYNVVLWRGGGMQYWAVSDLNVTELEILANLLH